MRPFPFAYKPHLFRSFATEARELVMGLRWSWRGGHGPATALGGAGLVCELEDEAGQVSELIHAGQPRNANGSVIHTGHGVPGNWDNERVFVFLDALPRNILQLRLALSAPLGVSGARPIRDVSRAWSHLSDRQSEQLILSRGLARAEGRTRLDIAGLVRDGEGWKVVDLMRGAARHDEAHPQVDNEPLVSGRMPQPVLERSALR